MPEPAPGSLAEALAALQGRLPRVAKEHTAKVETKTGGNYKYAYADLTDVSAAILPLMSELGLSFSARPTVHPDFGFVLTYDLLHTSGESSGGYYPLPDPARLGPQDLGKAITYARRYSLTAITGLAPGGDDDDGKAATDALRAAADPPKQPRNIPDAQLAASGQMTRAQKAGHERLAADTVRSDRKAERSHPRAPDPDDPWAQDAPVDHERAAALRADLEGRELPEDKPGTSSLVQQQAIAIELAGKGITTREDKLAYCGIVTGRDIGSSKELSYNEAAAVLKAAGELEAVNA